jgi:hypothetical protein
MSKKDELRYGAVSENPIHLCVDRQRMFAETTEWKTPWLSRFLPNIVAITVAHAERTIHSGPEARPKRRARGGTITSAGHR